MTTYSPLFGGDFALGTKGPMERVFFRLARRNKKLRELMVETIGSAAGETALVTEKRVAHSTTELGGVRSVETRTVINRATTTDDITNLEEMLTTDSRIATPADAAGSWSA